MLEVEQNKPVNAEKCIELDRQEILKCNPFLKEQFETSLFDNNILLYTRLT